MARGRKKSVSMLETYNTELQRLLLLEKEMIENLESIKSKIQITKDKIKIEEFNQIKEIMEKNNMTFDDVRNILTQSNVIHDNLSDNVNIDNTDVTDNTDINEEYSNE